MPASIETTPSGFITFTAVKLIGYSLYALALNRAYSASRNALAVGGTRTALGIALGASYYYSWRAFGADTHHIAYWAGLIPVRFFEWWLLIRIFYDRGFKNTSTGRRMIVTGTGWSYVLDLPAAFGYLICGLSIC